MAATWQEVSGTRRKDDSSTQYTDWTMQLTGLVASVTEPVLGEEITDIVTSSSNILDATTGYDDQPQCIQVSRITKQTILKSSCTVRFRSLKVE